MLELGEIFRWPEFGFIILGNSLDQRSSTGIIYMKQKLLKKFVCAGAAAGLAMGSARAAIIYDNAAGYNGSSFANISTGEEIGNEISLPTSSLTSFEFEYYNPPGTTYNPNLGVDVRFYKNDGPTTANGYATPGTVFFDSGWSFGIPYAPSGLDYIYNVSDFASGAQNGWGSGGYSLPNNFTFTITWTNLNAADQIQLPLANNTPGISTGAYWYNNGGGFELLTNTAPSNLLVEFQGQSSAVPEPSTVFAGVLMSLPFWAAGIRALRKHRAA
jgi:hypothetical protein